MNLDRQKYMKYYLIAGEASGDLHASRLMHSLKKQDAEASFRFIGGDMMAAAPCPYHTAQHGAMQGRHHEMGTRRGNPRRLSGIQPEYRQVRTCQGGHASLLLYLTEDMGMEGMAHQSDPP